MMTDEEKEAIDDCKNFMNVGDYIGEKEYKELQITINYIDKLQKVIDLMAYEIALPGRSIEIIQLLNNINPDKPIYDLVKEHFYKKVEE